MSRKPKKGYYVRGVFVAEGSELDIELKAELKGTDEASKTDLKRESTELQKLGEDLLELRSALFDRLALPEKLADAVIAARKITNFEGKRRQMQFIGKLMRKQEPEVLDAIRAALEEQHSGSVADTIALHQAENWRDRLISDENGLAPWLKAYPGTDTQQLRALIRQARKDAKPENPSLGQAPRQGRAYREIFQLVREQMSAVPAPEPEDGPGPANLS